MAMAIEHVEIVDFPMENLVISRSYGTNYQKVTKSEPYMTYGRPPEEPFKEHEWT